MGDKRMTLNDLIRALKNTKRQVAGSGEYVVWTQGCDCDGDVGCVTLDKKTKTIYLQRTCEGA